MPSRSVSKSNSGPTKDERGTTELREISEGRALVPILERLARFARTNEPILLQGETGTGKTHLARWLHSRSDQSAGPFHLLNLAGLDDGIASAELFGYVPGAFTDARERRAGAIAATAGGTLLLDEIGKSSLVVQRKLLDVLERRVYRPLGCDRDVRATARLVFAASEPLEDLVSAGTMLRDLVPRLGFFKVVVPPLRERREDIPGLVRCFVRRHAAAFGWTAGVVPRVSNCLDAALVGHDWPDNVRELENLVRRLLIDASGSAELTSLLLRDDLARYDARDRSHLDLRQERARSVQEALVRNKGNHSKAARELKMSRSRLYDYERMLRTGEIRLTS